MRFFPMSAIGESANRRIQTYRDFKPSTGLAESSEAGDGDKNPCVMDFSGSIISVSCRELAGELKVRQGILVEVSGSFLSDPQL